MTCLVAGFKLEITAVRSVVEKSTAGRFCAKLASWWHVWFVGSKEETTWRYYTGEPRPGWSKLVLLVAGYWTWLLKRFRGRWPGIRLEAHCSSSPEIRGLLRPENGTEESARGSFMSQPGGNWPSGGWRGWSLCLPSREGFWELWGVRATLFKGMGDIVASGGEDQLSGWSQFCMVL